jgi:hypothetical protein
MWLRCLNLDLGSVATRGSTAGSRPQSGSMSCRSAATPSWSRGDAPFLDEDRRDELHDRGFIDIESPAQDADGQDRDAVAVQRSSDINGTAAAAGEAVLIATVVSSREPADRQLVGEANSTPFRVQVPRNPCKALVTASGYSSWGRWPALRSAHANGLAARSVRKTDGRFRSVAASRVPA